MPNRYTAWHDIGPIRSIVIDFRTIRRLTGGLYDGTYGYKQIATGERVVYEGLMLGRRSDTYRFVPYHPSAAYGVGSDTMVGVLDERLDVTNIVEQPCTPIYAGELAKRYLYQFGANMGTIPADLATDLPDIHLKPEVYTA
jgi:hypothetical protein